jgi:hypothetical protein
MGPRFPDGFPGALLEIIMDMSLCHEGVLVEHECVCESRRVRVRRVGVCHIIVESEREREFVLPQPLVVWG